jgi:Spy/CpxP family protein refolding chaperone
MRDKASSLGTKIVEAERSLDQAFSTGRVDTTELRSKVSTIAALQGELRITHLEAHVAQHALLTPEQIVRYDALRGYVANVAPHSAHRH